MSLGRLASPFIVGLALASCSTAASAPPVGVRVSGSGTPTRHPPAIRRAAPSAISFPAPGSPLPGPVALVPFGRPAGTGQGTWARRPFSRRGPAVYETTLVPPGGTRPAGIAWMDTGLLSARLYSGSESPGGGPYRYTAPVAPARPGRS